MTKIIQYTHRPNNTELGKGNTHETYLLIGKEHDLADLFPDGVDVNLKAVDRDSVYTVKTAIGREFRINQFGPLFRDYDICEGDEIILTIVEQNGLHNYYVRVNTYNRILLSQTSKGCMIGNIERIASYGNKENGYELHAVKNGVEGILKIVFDAAKAKRSDSPDLTDFYTVTFNGLVIENGTYCFDINDTSLFPLEKSQFDEIILNGENIPLATINNTCEHKATNNQNNLPHQKIFYGAPGTGKSHKIDEQTNDNNSIRVTFHPDTDYATFVGAYKPMMEETEVRAIPVVLNNGASFDQNNGTYKEKHIVYKFEPQAFLKAYVEAWKRFLSKQDEGNDNYYLVIEEINRGNCAQIFGDLFQLLDREDSGYSSYAISPESSIAKYLNEYAQSVDGTKFSELDFSDVTKKRENSIAKIIASADELKKGKKLVLPPNLHIWATMNTSDQSLFPIDSAFKRRWDWEYMPIKYGNSEWMIEISGNKYSWLEFQKEINKKVFEATESEDKQLGDYFVKANGNNIISAQLLLNKVIFYLWNDVCKDGDGDIFKINTDLDYTKELDSTRNKDITFSQFFDNTDTTLQQWMRYLNITPMQESDNTDKDDEERQLQIETGTDEKDAQKVKYSKPIYKTIIENMIDKLEGQTLAFFSNGFDWAFTNMPKSYTRTTLTLDSNANTAYVKLWIPAESGYRNSRECFDFIKEHNGEAIISSIAEKNKLQLEELGKKSTNPKPVLGWSMRLPMTFSEENTSANAEKLLQLMTDVHIAFDSIITDFMHK